VVRAHP